nr:retinal G protein coupled receptor b isoform X2 [Gasterosteus aculeatus aculeatus]
MWNPSNFFVFNLAVADICLNVNGLTAAYASYLRYWPFGQDGCTFHAFQGMIAVLASISFMGVIAWDRYHQYCTRQKLFWSTTLTMSAIIWILSIFWAAVPLMGWGVYDFEPMRTCCTLDYTKGDRDYVTYMLTLVFLYLMFPALTMWSCYDAIHKHFKKIHLHKFNTSTPLRVLLMCWGPYVLMCIYACFENVKVVSPKLRMVLPVVAKTNPIFNALLYSFGNEFYRGGVWHFLTGQKMVDPVVKKSK